MKKAAQYLRMSTEEQRYSIENQANLIAEHARREGYEIVRTYQDAGRSGVTTARRDGLKRLLGDVLAGPPFTVIFVADVSRWGRYQDPDEGAHYEHLCREAGVRVEYCAESFRDDGMPTSALIKSVKRVMAGEYSRQLSERCRAGLRRTIQSGRNGGGSPPFGFIRQSFESDGTPGVILRPHERRSRADHHVRVVPGDPEHLKTVRRIFKLFVIDALGLSGIARLLNIDRVPHSRSGAWTDCRVRAVLKDERAIGVFAFNRTSSRFGKVTRLNREEWLRIRVGDPIVSVRRFAAAQKRLAGFRRSGWSDEEMIGKLRELLGVHGLLSRRLVNTTPGVPNGQTYDRRFGSLSAAFALAGFSVAPSRTSRYETRHLKPDEFLVRLRRLYETHGYLNASLINASPDVPHANTFRDRFGDLGTAYARVGYVTSRSDRLRAGRERRHDGEPLLTRSAAGGDFET